MTNVINIPKITLYHGSPDKIIDIKDRLGIDLGNRFQSPAWSLFCWNKLDPAISWGIYKNINKYIKSESRNNAAAIYNPKTYKILIGSDYINYIEDLFNKNNLYSYVYKFNVPINLIGIGHHTNYKEYTIRSNEPDKYLSGELKFRITKDILYNNTEVI
jgi:hypothetical protein